MDENGGIKLSGIRQIVKLKASLKQWQAVSKAKAAKEKEKEKLAGGGGSGCSNMNNNEKEMMMMMSSSGSSSSISHGVGGILSAAMNKRLVGTLCCDSDEESSSCQSPEHLVDVPKGYLAVYVGRELRRFIIPTAYLSHSVFKVLLEKAEEEFGFDHTGGLTFPCEIETFKYILNCMETQLHEPPPLPPPAGANSLTMEGRNNLFT